ncbi:MAG: glycosyltransferase [Oscillospiraceae bacterium]|jgi:glycosyltransferase involved in cell wall biosynthesis|nr:glycosyltransferase [Oscillospiraceae bacterium]
MKARVSQSTAKTLSYTYDKKIIVSVSMIVKNEEKMLGTCLDGLKPLLDAVPSELIIVDTGSTDKTVEIARRYTDRIEHFDWVNDFAAARNFGLEKCRGQWFMFLDADDHFEDISDLIEFFSNENIHRNYNTAYYITRNYTTMQYDTYFNFCAHRINRKTDDLRFEGAIHEYFNNFYLPAYYSNSYALHYGYAFETEEKLIEKSKRNLVLLEKELEKDPDNLRNIYHTVSSMLFLDDRKRELIERSLPLADKSDEPVLFTAYFNAFEMYKKEEQNEKALDVIDRAISKANPDNAVLAEAYAFKGGLLNELGRFSEAEESIRNFLEYYKKYENNELDRGVLGFVVSNWLMPEKRDSMQNTLALCISGQNRPAEAFSVYADTDFGSVSAETFGKIISTVIEIAGNQAAFETDSFRKELVKFYEKIIGTGGEDKTAYFVQELEKLYYRDREFAKSFEPEGEEAAPKGKFAEFMRICANGDNAGLEEFTESFDALPAGYSEAVYLALMKQIDLSGAISKMNFELIMAHLTTIALYNDNLPLLALNYKSDEFYFSSIKNLLFGTLLFEAACSRAGALNDVQKSALYRIYLNYSSLYVANVYNADLLNESDVGALPESDRFGYYMGAAQKELDAGNKLSYVRELKKALTSCNSKQEIIKFIINEFSATL